MKREELKKEFLKYEQLLTESEEQLTRILPDYDRLRHEEEQKTAQYIRIIVFHDEGMS